jgi:hypothetical protein
MLGRNVQIKKRVPQCEMRAPDRAELSWETDEGWGPIGEFLYEVGEMKIGSHMGKLMVDEMVGS